MSDRKHFVTFCKDVLCGNVSLERTFLWRRFVRGRFMRGCVSVFLGGIGKMVEALVLELAYISLGDVKCLSSKYLVLSTPLTFRLFLPTEW